jgi:hypothetical protein
VVGLTLGASVFGAALIGISPAYAATTTKEQATAAKAGIKAQDVIKLALKQVGIHENSRGGGTKFQRWFMSSPAARDGVRRHGGSVTAYANAPWCSMFVSWVGDLLGIRPSIGADAYTVTHAQWFRRHGRFGQKATPGSVVFYSFNGRRSIDSISHVGFVIKDNGNGTIRTVEGNTGSGQVMVRTRSKSSVVGYGYPRYAT